MSKELVIHMTRGEINIALLEDKQLVELSKESKNVKFNVGDVYLAKVKKIMAGLNAAFVDVGYEKDAFLHYHDLGPQFQSLNKYLELVNKKGKVFSFEKFKGQPDINKFGKITQVIKSGQMIMVQIAKEPIANKGPRLTSEISIAGRNLVLLPFSDKVSVSQKIESYDERNRLKQLLKSIKPKNYGVIIRTAAEGKKVAVLDNELRQLALKWENGIDRIKGSKPPSLIMGEISRTSAMVRDILSMSFNNIYVDDETLYNEIKEYINEIAPEKKKIVKYYNGKVPIFENMGIDKQIKSLFGRIVPFKNGAYLILEPTEALHVIDVNSGNRAEAKNDQEANAVEINLAAAEEIARQLRLRDIGGIIVIDFIDMHSPENKVKVFERMKEVMSKDRAKHSILPLSRFGLMQITRQRVRPELNVKTYEKCPTCKGTGEIMPSTLLIDEIENDFDNIVKTNPDIKKILLKVHPFVASFIKQGFFNSIRKKWQSKFGIKLKVQPVNSFTFFDRQFLDNEGADINSLMDVSKDTETHIETEESTEE